MMDILMYLVRQVLGWHKDASMSGIANKETA